MTSWSWDKEIEEKLIEAGNKITDPPTSLEELLSLLDRTESLLARVKQSPSKSMGNAVTPSLKALVSNQLLRHSDVDVKVAVAACISEITRITAPDPPYNDEQMKEVFHLIVSSFENLSDKSSRSYGKRASILENVAKVRSCVVMLDLECDGLIIEMFQHFLKTVRDYHPENVFSSMETIMSLVLEESDDISEELLSPILDSVKKDNEEFLPIARKLGQRVLDNCSTKLKPYLVHAVKVKPPTEVITPERVDVAIEKHHDSVKNNGIGQGGEDGSFTNIENKKEEHGSEECKEVKSSKSSETANLDSRKIIKPPTPKVMENESVNVVLPSRNGILPDGNSNAVGQMKKKDNSARVVTSPTDYVSRKLSEVTGDSDVKLGSHAEEMGDFEDKILKQSGENKTAGDEDVVEFETDTTSGSEDKTLKQSARKVGGTSKSSRGSSGQSEAKRRQGLGKYVSGKGIKNLSGDHDEEEPVTSSKPTLKKTKHEKILVKITKTSFKRKHNPSQEQIFLHLDSEALRFVRNLLLLCIVIFIFILSVCIMITSLAIGCGSVSK